jgi:hypothetical protein
METDPPDPEVDPDTKVTVGLLMAHVGRSVAPVGELASVQELRVMVFGPI